VSILAAFLLLQIQNSEPLDLRRDSIAQKGQTLGICVTTQAEVWADLPDDANSIANGTLHVCNTVLQEFFMQQKAEMLQQLMKSGRSTVGLDEWDRLNRLEVRRLLQNAAIATVLEIRMNKMKLKLK